MVSTAKNYGMKAIGLTDHGNMYAAINFYKACKKAGIKPIIGVEAYVAPEGRTLRRPGIDGPRNTYHLTLLAKDIDGYKNLMKLVTRSHLEGFYYKPRMDHEILREHSDGLIALSGCLGGELCSALWARDEEKALSIIKKHQDIFGAENYYIEVMHHPGLDRMEEIMAGLVKLAKENNIKMVGTQDCHYLHKEDHNAHDTLLAIQTGDDVNNKDRLSLSDDDFSFIDPETANQNFAFAEGAVQNTLEIADRCNLEIPLGSWVFPDYKIPVGTSYDSELLRLAKDGIPKRGLEGRSDVLERLDYELGIIRDKGYSPYFLVVADLIRFARENDIYTNIRGSVAGSLTTYLLGITSVNPIDYQIPFERFLNPERPSAPDIDMDFADKRRDEVINYAKEKYGEDKVAQLCTFGTMLARGSVRDVARALGEPYSVGDRIAKLIPIGSQGFPMTIDHAIDITPELKELIESDEATKKIINLAKRMEGCARHISVHAAGVMISPTPIVDYTPLQLDPKGGKIITQYDMYSIEDAGLLKFDFLGIRNLSILADSVAIVKRTHGISVDIENIPLDDQKTYDMLGRGETMGLFQLNGSGMTKYLKDLRPSTIHDINVMVALYRPGPLESIPEYIRRKHDPSLVSYMDTRMKDYLQFSYGLLVYQDDVLMTAINLAGYSWLEADKLRKAMGKKIPVEMQAEKKKLIKGFITKGMEKKKAEELWHLIEPFAAYGFGKAHAASYGRTAYQTSYMKANFPAEYMTAVLTAESGDVEEVAKVIDECKNMKIPVLPPDINKSWGDFMVLKANTKDNDTERDEIRFGLYTIKNLGKDISDAIISEREAGGAYTSFADFLERVKHKNLTKKSMEALIMAGAMDELGERGNLLGNMETALEYNKARVGGGDGQSSLFGLMEDKSSVPTFTLKQFPPATMTEKLAWEKELLGLFVSGHPLDPFKERFAKSENSIAKLKSENKATSTVVAGIIDEVREVMTKKSERMSFVKLSDFTGSMEVVFFPRAHMEAKSLLIVGKCIAVRGQTSTRNEELSLIAEATKELA